jgi:hypothetical protein
MNIFKVKFRFFVERFYEDPDKLFQTLNVANPNLSPSIQWNPLSPACIPKRDPLLPTTDNSNNTCRTYEIKSFFFFFKTSHMF